MTRRWGKAGVRLTPAEAAANDRHRAERAYWKRKRDQDAYDLWRQGKLVPHRITAALDLRELYGPEVDEACGAKEPDVDMWEAGTLYPTWEQFLALAKLTNFPAAFFFKDIDGPLAGDTSLRWHRLGGQTADYRQPPLVRCFTPEALAAIKEAT